MGHDVFISYSSKNSTTAQAICHELEDNGVRCWMAPRNIPVGSKYASVITQAIKECKAVVLVFSEQSAISPWVESEINIAFSNRKPIVPYKIDAATLENYDEFYLMLNNRHWIEAYPDFKTRFAELVTVVSSLVGVVPTESNKSNGVVVQSHTKTYKVGDYYDDGVKEGVVFDVWDDGRHGKIVSLDQAELQWCTDSQYNKEIIVGTSSRSNGKENQGKIPYRYSISTYFRHKEQPIRPFPTDGHVPQPLPANPMTTQGRCRHPLPSMHPSNGAQHSMSHSPKPSVLKRYHASRPPERMSAYLPAALPNRGCRFHSRQAAEAPRQDERYRASTEHPFLHPTSIPDT